MVNGIVSLISLSVFSFLGFPGGSDGKESTCNAGDPGLIPEINIIKMSTLPKAIYRFNSIPIHLPMVFFTGLEQIISQIVWKYKKTSNSQSNLDKEEWNRRNQPA